MNPKKIHVFQFIILGIIFLPSINFPQNRQAYLTVNTTGAMINCDSLFLNSLKMDIKEALLKKNIFLRRNSEVEKANSSYIYLTIDISDSVYINAKRLSNDDNYISTSKYDKKVWKYYNASEVRKYIVAYIKEAF